MLRNGLAGQAKPSTLRCSRRGSGRRECATSFVRSQIARLAPLENGLRDVRGEIAEADEPREVRWAHALALGQRGKWHAIVVDKCGIEPARSDQQLDAPPLGFGCRHR